MNRKNIMRRLAIKVPPNRITIKHCTFRLRVYLVCPQFPQSKKKKKIETKSFFLRVFQNIFICVMITFLLHFFCNWGTVPFNIRSHFPS